MTIAEDFALAVTSLREVTRLLENVAVVYPEAEAQIKSLSINEETPEGVRAMLKVLHAMGVFAVAQKRGEETINTLAIAQEAPASRYAN